ncbi:heavy-metal-associated domain-containing protein [Agromyces sp. SYSU T00266]|uniref:heavy-metal-associated domain-containing protein n=1 Tax=Agromyces zhanjiangensis TaxID=3158562 RepID=UPI0033921D54
MSRSRGEMSPALRLGLFGAGVAAVFGVAIAAGPLIVPPDRVAAWAEQSEDRATSHGGAHEAPEGEPVSHEVPGLSIEADGYRLADLHAPAEAGSAESLHFRILDAEGDALTSFDETHERPLHLIVVRSDGAQFRHVHPELEDDGHWSIPWEWEAAGTYRLFADFRPTGHDETLTLTTTANVNGLVTATDAPAPGSRVAEAGPFTVELTGDLAAGAEAELEFTVQRDGRPVTTIEPYLGAAGHLVMLRAGDLGYLHAHPLDEAESAGASELGPDIRFAATPPTAGDYLLYVDFKVDGQAHTAAFAVDAALAAAEAGAHADGGEHADGH